jgi:hypothetical protein
VAFDVGAEVWGSRGDSGFDSVDVATASDSDAYFSGFARRRHT